jgi:hypothetical protein
LRAAYAPIIGAAEDLYLFNLHSAFFKLGPAGPAPSKIYQFLRYAKTLIFVRNEF